MIQTFARASMAALLLAAAAGVASAQQTGKPGVNPDTSQAGTGNSGDNSVQPGTQAGGTKSHHRKHHARKAKAAASAASM